MIVFFLLLANEGKEFLYTDDNSYALVQFYFLSLAQSPFLNIAF